MAVASNLRVGLVVVRRVGTAHLGPLGDKVLNNPFSRSVERATSRSAFSWLRIAYLLVMLILMIGAFVTVLHLWRH